MFTSWLYFVLDILPFLPFWCLLALIWAAFSLKPGQDKISRISGGLSLFFLLLTPFFWSLRPKVSLALLMLVFLLFVYNLIRLWKKGFPKIIAGIAIAGAFLILFLYRQPQVLVWRLGLYPSSLAQDRLAQNQPRYLNAILKGMQSQNPQKQAALWFVLAKIGETESLTPEYQGRLEKILRENSNSYNREVFSCQLAALRSIQPPGTADFLISRLRRIQPQEENLYPQTLEILEKFDRPVLLDQVKAELEKNPVNANALAAALSALGGRLSPKEIKRWQADPQAALSLLNYFQALPELNPSVLRSFLSDRRLKVKEKVLDICLRRNLKVLIPDLPALLTDPDPGIRSFTNSVLINLTGKNAGYDYAARDLKAEQQKWKKVIPILNQE